MTEETPFQKVEDFHRIFDPRSPESPTALQVKKRATVQDLKLKNW